MFQTDKKTVTDQRTPGDDELVRLAQQGSLEAFTDLYQRYLPVVYNRVRYVVPERDIEDVVQEVFITLLKALRSYRGNSKFSTWLRTLTNRRIVDYYRRRSRTEEIQLDAEQTDAETSVAPELRTAAESTAIEERVVLRQMLQALPEPYQEVILLRFAEELPFDEIARVRGQSLEATKSLFRRALATLRKQVGETHG
jgi:RNA polymerase sigma-70 factor (ECF subfamily)